MLVCCVVYSIIAALCIDVATMGAKGAHGPLTFVLFSIVSMSRLTFAILNHVTMLWSLFTASNTPGSMWYIDVHACCCSCCVV